MLYHAEKPSVQNIIKVTARLQDGPSLRPNSNMPYILEYNLHPNLIRTQVLAILKRKKVSSRF
jgi:hypothetical protein